MILIADSGSTKTDWALVSDDGQVSLSLQTEGITPVHQTEEQMAAIVEKVISCLDASLVGKLYFYGSGIIPFKKPMMEQLLGRLFPDASVVEADNDLLGAARSLCGRTEGVACILGTGANSCLYDGNNIVKNTPPLGYILGDEGSGAVLGKLFLNALFKGELPSEMREDYLKSVDMSYADIIDRVYRQPMANRFLATTSLYISHHLDCLLLRKLVVGNFRQFIRKNVSPYQRPDLPIHAVGSIAWYYSELLEEASAAENTILGTVLKSPMDGLIRYHSQQDA